jgi:hypothetical protein
MKLFGLAGLLSALAFLTGCARAVVTTNIQPDGAWTRTVVFTGQEKKEDMQVTPTLDDTFALPSGPGWNRKEESKNGDRVLTFERTLAAGTPLQGDVLVKAGLGGYVRLSNEVVVTRSGPKRFEYRETIKWKGPTTAPFVGDFKPDALTEIKSALPQPLATDANARAIADKMADLAIPMLFGPGDPLLAVGLMHPDLAARRAGQRIGALLIKSLEQQFGDRLTPDQRKDIARRMIQGTFTSAKMSSDPAAPPASKNEGSLTPLMFVVKTPGRIILTNGEVDELTGEAFWALFDAAASVKDIVLTATVELP